MIPTTSRALALDSWVIRFNEFLEKWEKPAIAALLLALLTVAAGYAEIRPLWQDEYFSFYTATQPSAAAIWQMQKTSPLEAEPPLYHWLAHLSMRLLGSNAFALRLPSVLAYGLACLCIYRLVRKWDGPLMGMIAMLLTSATVLFHYSHEARPYMLMTAGCVAATLAWSVAVDGQTRWRGLATFGLFLSLAAAVSSHWYGVLATVPVIGGELTRLIRERQVRWNVLFGIFAGAAVGLLYIPLLAASKVYQARIWKGVFLSDLPAGYMFFLERNSALLAIAFAILAFGSLHLLLPDRNWTSLRSTSNRPVHEFAAALACGLIPGLAFLLARFVVHSFIDRYVIVWGSGMIVLIVIGTRWATRSRIVLLTIVLGAAFVGFTARVYGLGTEERQPVLDKSSAALENYSQLPVVIDAQELFFTICTAAPGLTCGRFVYLTDSTADNILRQNTLTLSSRALQRETRLPVLDYASFLKERSRFLLVSDFQGNYQWVAQALQAQGAILNLVGTFCGHPVFLVANHDQKTP